MEEEAEVPLTSTGGVGWEADPSDESRQRDGGVCSAGEDNDLDRPGFLLVLPGDAAVGGTWGGGEEGKGGGEDEGGGGR
jgi:hypothetical protein